MADTQKQIRCAIYTRKSTDEGLDQEFNSLDAQRESAEAFVRQPDSTRAGRLPPRLATTTAATHRRQHLDRPGSATVS